MTSKLDRSGRPYNATTDGINHLVDLTGCEWDPCDPVAMAIWCVVDAQNELQRAHAAFAQDGVDNVDAAVAARTDAILGLLHASGWKNQSMIAEQKIFDAAIETLMSLHTEVGDEPVLAPQDPAALASLIQWLEELNAGL